MEYRCSGKLQYEDMKILFLPVQLFSSLSQNVALLQVVQDSLALHSSHLSPHCSHVPSSSLAKYPALHSMHLSMSHFTQSDTVHAKSEIESYQTHNIFHQYFLVILKYR